MGYFDDDKVALVQSPHDFYNQDSVQHYEPGRHEQSMFFEVVCPGKDRHNGVFWCGSAALLRRTALVGVGGVATETIAEDFHTTIKLHRDGLADPLPRRDPGPGDSAATTSTATCCSGTAGHAATSPSSPFPSPL